MTASSRSAHRNRPLEKLSFWSVRLSRSELACRKRFEDNQFSSAFLIASCLFRTKEARLPPRVWRCRFSYMSALLAFSRLARFEALDIKPEAAKKCPTSSITGHVAFFRSSLNRPPAAGTFSRRSGHRHQAHRRSDRPSQAPRRRPSYAVVRSLNGYDSACRRSRRCTYTVAKP